MQSSGWRPSSRDRVGPTAALWEWPSRPGGDGIWAVWLVLGWTSQQRPHGTVAASLTVVSNPNNVWSGGGKAAENEAACRNFPQNKDAAIRDTTCFTFLTFNLREVDTVCNSLKVCYSKYD